MWTRIQALSELMKINGIFQILINKLWTLFDMYSSYSIIKISFVVTILKISMLQLATSNFSLLNLPTNSRLIFPLTLKMGPIRVPVNFGFRDFLLIWICIRSRTQIQGVNLNATGIGSETLIFTEHNAKSPEKELWVLWP